MELNKIYNVDAYELVKTLPDNSVDLIIADPPSGAGLIKANWDKKMTALQYATLISSFSRDCYDILNKTGNFYLKQWEGEKNPVHMSCTKYLINVKTNFIFKDFIIWKKQRGNGNRKGWLQTCQFLLWYVKDNKKFIWNKENQYSQKERSYTITGSKNKSKYLRWTNVWVDIKEMGFGSCPKYFKKLREKFGKHETPDPPELYERIILAHTKEGDTVFIPFSGSGVAEEVCKKLNRNFISCELNDK